MFPYIQTNIVPEARQPRRLRAKFPSLFLALIILAFPLEKGQPRSIGLTGSLIAPIIGHDLTDVFLFTFVYFI